MAARSCRSHWGLSAPLWVWVVASALVASSTEVMIQTQRQEMRFASCKCHKDGFAPALVGGRVCTGSPETRNRSMHTQNPQNTAGHSWALPAAGIIHPLQRKEVQTHGAAGCQHTEDGGPCPEPFSQQVPGGAGLLLALQQHLEQAPCRGSASSTSLSTQEPPQGQLQVIPNHRREILHQGKDLWGKQHQNPVRAREKRAAGWKCTEYTKHSTNSVLTTTLET